MATASFSTDESRKASNSEEIFMQRSLHFTNGLKDLKNLREQLYLAAEHFESSFNKEEHKQVLVETSKDYVAKALVNTIDHLGSVSDKLNKFLDEKADEFSHTNNPISCIHQKLNTFRGFIEFRGIPRESTTVEAPKHHKKYIIRGEENFQFGKKPNLLYSNCISCPQYDDMHQIKQENTSGSVFQVAAVKQHPKSLRKGKSKFISSPNPPQQNDFSFTRVVPKKETAAKRSASPLRLPIMRSGLVANPSASPGTYRNKEPDPSGQRRRAITVMSRRTETMNVESYSKKNKHMFKAIFTMNRAAKDTGMADFGMHKGSDKFSS
ncbi:hypothetical protein F511_06950 [Dorcoceras hygrometricum]|uniref:Protein ABIL2-like n=1 Tax=Dorcoceras hygrometricum TaxID=472368 RepID=A0A2Z7CWJ1_9LAMI|nr:hypothetical protein F511_06950 [Dorcoceras hygrometricum]